jgi:hypothetical protein
VYGSSFGKVLSRLSFVNVRVGSLGLLASTELILHVCRVEQMGYTGKWATVVAAAAAVAAIMVFATCLVLVVVAWHVHVVAMCVCCQLVFVLLLAVRWCCQTWQLHRLL